MVIKLIIQVLYFGIFFMIGILASRRLKGLSDYYACGKNVGFWSLSFSARATKEQGWLL